MRAAELMTTNVCTCSSNDTLDRVAQMMWERDCGAVPIADEDGRVVGIVTDRDICMGAYTQGKLLSEIPVSTVAARKVVFAQPDDTVEFVEVLMRSAKVRRVPVLDAGGRAVGIVSLSDIARELSKTPSADPVATTLAAIAQPHAAAPAHSKSPVYHVRSVNGGWEVFDRDGNKLTEQMLTQADAVIHAKELARRASGAQIIVHGEGERIVSEFFYQEDERSALFNDDSVRSIAASQPAHTRRAP